MFIVAEPARPRLDIIRPRLQPGGAAQYIHPVANSIVVFLCRSLGFFQRIEMGPELRMAALRHLYRRAGTKKGLFFGTGIGRFTTKLAPGYEIVCAAMLRCNSVGVLVP